jgi:FHA domain
MGLNDDHLAERVCTNCKMKCTPTQLYCPRCGYVLPSALEAEAHALGSTSTLLPVELPPSVNTQPGTGFFHRQARLFLHHDSGQTIPVDIRSGPKLVGRFSGDPLETNVVDLTALGAKEFGVSRRHIQLSLSDETIYVIDLGSTNGSFLNRERLIAERPYVVRNRAVLQLGVLIMRVQFA